MYIQSLTTLLPFHRTSRAERSAGWAALAGTILAGSTGVTFAAALAGALSPLSMLFISETLMLLFTALSFGLFPLLKRLRKIKRRAIVPILLVALSNSVVAPLLAFTGIRSTGPVNAELFMHTHDLFLMILAVAFLGERLKPKHALGAAFIFTGVTVVALRGLTTAITLAYGDALILAAALCYALGSALYKKHLHQIEPELMIFCRTCTALVIFFLASPFLRHTLAQELRNFPGELLVALFGYALFSRFLSLFCFYEALDAFARLYLGVPIEVYHIAGAGLILMGCGFLELESFTGKTLHFVAHLKQKQRAHV
jgi:drug/metabolite transporter (DMT)-like permease